MRIYYSRFFPPKGFLAINLFGVIIGRKGFGKLSRNVINHELVHTYQMIELLWIFFYILYIIEWIVRAIQYRSFLKGYYNISFEREAYRHGNDFDYLFERKNYAFLKFYNKKWYD